MVSIDYARCVHIEVHHRAAYCEAGKLVTVLVEMGMFLWRGLRSVGPAVAYSFRPGCASGGSGGDKGPPWKRVAVQFGSVDACRLCAAVWLRGKEVRRSPGLFGSVRRGGVVLEPSGVVSAPR